MAMTETNLLAPFGKEPGIGRTRSHIANFASRRLIAQHAIHVARVSTIESLAEHPAMPHSFAAGSWTLQFGIRRNKLVLVVGILFHWSTHLAPFRGLPLGTGAQVTTAHSWQRGSGAEASGLVHSHGQCSGDFLLAGQVASLNSIPAGCATRTPITQYPPVNTKTKGQGKNPMKILGGILSQKIEKNK